MSLDVSLFEKLNNLVYHWKFLDFVGIFFANYLQWILLAIFLVFLFFWKKEFIMKKTLIISAAVSVVLSRLIIGELLKIVVHRARPYVVLETAKKLIAENNAYQSFPSGHATIFFALAMAIWFYNKKPGNWFFVGAILMGIARIFVGVHWPSDILGGAIIGILSAIIIDKLVKRYGSQTKNSRDSGLAGKGSEF